MVDFKDFVDFRWGDDLLISKTIFNLMNDYINTYKNWTEHYKTELVKIKESRDKDLSLHYKKENELNNDITKNKETIRELDIKIKMLEQNLKDCQPNNPIPKVNKFIFHQAEQENNIVDDNKNDPWKNIISSESALYRFVEDEVGDIVPVPFIPDKIEDTNTDKDLKLELELELEPEEMKILKYNKKQINKLPNSQRVLIYIKKVQIAINILKSKNKAITIPEIILITGLSASTVRKYIKQ